MAQLLAIAREHWVDIDGYCVGHGIDLDTLPVPRFLNFIQWWCTKNMDEKERSNFESLLWTPPIGEEGQGVWSSEAETEALMAFKARA